MAIKMVTLKCPECGAKLEYEDGRKIVYCSYCGSKILINNENEYIYRKIDEAALERAKTNYMVKKSKIEKEKQESAAAALKLRVKIIVSIILGIVGGLMFTIGMMAGDASKDWESPYYSLAAAGCFAFFAIVGIWVIDSK